MTDHARIRRGDRVTVDGPHLIPLGRVARPLTFGERLAGTRIGPGALGLVIDLRARPPALIGSPADEAELAAEASASYRRRRGDA